MMSPRAAIRWSPSASMKVTACLESLQKDVYIMGISHEFGPWGLRREFTYFDESVILPDLTKSVNHIRKYYVEQLDRKFLQNPF